MNGHNGQVASDPSIVPHLTERQKIILCCLLKGDTNKIIARQIAITEATVKVHVKMILRKINVQNRTQAAIWAMNHGYLISNKQHSSL
jgi:two-component system nitrate/nitrite response regulator NarL